MSWPRPSGWPTGFCADRPRPAGRTGPCARRRQLATAHRRGGVGHRSTGDRCWTRFSTSCPGVQIRADQSRIPLELSGELLVDDRATRYARTRTRISRRSWRHRRWSSWCSDWPTVRWSSTPTGRPPPCCRRSRSRVDGLPLALELAAGQASGRSLADIAVLFESPLDVPASGPPGNARHRSLRDTLEWSVSRLDADHRTVLRRLSVYVGHFDLADAAAVAGPIDNVGEIVRSLARDALIHVERTSASRLTFPVAAHGARPGRWRASTPTNSPPPRPCTDAGMPDSGAPASVDLVEDVREQCRRLSRGTPDGAGKPGRHHAGRSRRLTLTQFWQFIGGQAVGLRWIGRVLDSDVLSADERARVLAQRAALALHHDPPLVLADTALAIPILEAAGETASSVTALVTALSVRAFELYAQGRSAEAGVHADRAVSTARTGSADLLARALATAGLIHAVTERVELAGAAIDEARDYLDAMPASADRTATGSTLTLALVNLERFTDALEVSDSRHSHRSTPAALPAGPWLGGPGFRNGNPCAAMLCSQHSSGGTATGRPAERGDGTRGRMCAGCDRTSVGGLGVVRRAGVGGPGGIPDAAGFGPRHRPGPRAGRPPGVARLLHGPHDGIAPPIGAQPDDGGRTALICRRQIRCRLNPEHSGRSPAHGGANHQNHWGPAMTGSSHVQHTHGHA